MPSYTNCRNSIKALLYSSFALKNYSFILLPHHSPGLLTQEACSEFLLLLLSSWSPSKDEADDLLASARKTVGINLPCYRSP